MVADGGWTQGLVTAETRKLASANFDPPDEQGSGDHAAYTSGKTCKTCHQPIRDDQPARRRGDTEWSHDTCPAIPG